MNIQTRLDLLQRIYALYDDFCTAFPNACRKGCDLCCTANVTLTTLEGLLILDHGAEEPGIPSMDTLEAAARKPRFQPATTINQLAERCARGEAMTEEFADPSVGACPLLQHGLCSIYAVRPFGCRAMVSRSDCGRLGAAEMPEEVLAANTMILQFIEALDQGGLSGNLTDILLFLSQAAHRRAHARSAALFHPRLPAVNRPITVLMVPPEQQQRLAPLHLAIRRMMEEQL